MAMLCQGAGTSNVDFVERGARCATSKMKGARCIPAIYCKSFTYKFPLLSCAFTIFFSSWIQRLDAEAIYNEFALMALLGCSNYKACCGVQWYFG